MNKLLGLCAIIALTVPQPHNICVGPMLDAYESCSRVFSPTCTPFASTLITPYYGYLAICYGDYPTCNEAQKLAITDAGNCYIQEWRGQYVLPKNVFRPCEDPLPPRIMEKKFCTLNGMILSEYYGQLYTDIVRNNDNEIFLYNQTGLTLMSKSSGRCLVVAPTVTITTEPCDYTQNKQKWLVQYNRVYTSQCLVASNPFGHGVEASTKKCDFTYDINQYFTDCANVPKNYVRIASTRGKRISEYYSNLYFDDPRDNFNELFSFDASTQMFNSASSQQCLDSYLDTDGKFKVHTYECDANNANQKWIVHADTKQIEHATHKGQCLDGDPTYADRPFANVVLCTKQSKSAMGCNTIYTINQYIC
ncbi:hypothetical protein THRCLA_20936 [Thraustotheca clavata]|uniref:Ricin B lectin domain-containing protein n=1 Tax=Thraustotheca clavata TaxID=74557 RepID=A0A1W0A2G8_9STRA|nr:hypothetical protein THRCLA_20936 [Thraustotheca clavata]